MRPACQRAAWLEFGRILAHRTRAVAPTVYVKAANAGLIGDGNASNGEYTQGLHRLHRNGLHRACHLSEMWGTRQHPLAQLPTGPDLQV